MTQTNKNISRKDEKVTCIYFIKLFRAVFRIICWILCNKLLVVRLIFISERDLDLHDDPSQGQIIMLLLLPFFFFQKYNCV